MSPQVINGKTYSEKDDIWSVGCILYELCTK
jgi:serine/threonine protein kinase